MKKILFTKSKRLLATIVMGIIVTAIPTPVLASTGDIWKGSIDIGNVTQLLLHPDIFLDMLAHMSNYSYEVNGKGYDIAQANELFKAHPRDNVSIVANMIETQLIGAPLTGNTSNDKILPMP
ncbi:hypothetical protein REC12_10050 [Desulfosporosinus sp. PR]|uniref:hypothetical protein n=1 Tax=Candidatus Desulfosporosinus nitrosoreducens TaxID=3401928 RepID=UPI0027ED8E15|nr:hypothetical protein [Desulfosporosinus sp. PR]MDQ7093931.1 hypothetical protein [Desulfosporosinus sp. PR]